MRVPFTRVLPHDRAMGGRVAPVTSLADTLVRGMAQTAAASSWACRVRLRRAEGPEVTTPRDGEPDAGIGSVVNSHPARVAGRTGRRWQGTSDN